MKGYARNLTREELTQKNKEDHMPNVIDSNRQNVLPMQSNAAAAQQAPQKPVQENNNRNSEQALVVKLNNEEPAKKAAENDNGVYNNRAVRQNASAANEQTSTARADLDGDGVVDGKDLKILMSIFAENGTKSNRGDIDGSGTLDFFDFLKLQNSITGE